MKRINVADDEFKYEELKSDLRGIETNEPEVRKNVMKQLKSDLRGIETFYAKNYQ